MAESFEGTRIGDMTLCAVCNRAIQLIRSCHPATTPVDMWVHFSWRGCGRPHPAMPKRSMWDGDVTGG